MQALSPRRSAASASPLARLVRLVRPEQAAVIRTAIGTSMLVRPTMLPRAMGVDSATAARAAWVVQMGGAREVTLGVGTLIAVRRPDGRAARLWLMASLVTDALDAVIFSAATGRGRISPAMGAAAVATAATSVAIHAAALDEG